MSAHVMSGRSFALSFQLSTNVYRSGKTVPSAVISFSSYFFLSSLFKFEEYVVAGTRSDKGRCRKESLFCFCQSVTCTCVMNPCEMLTSERVYKVGKFQELIIHLLLST